MPRSDALHVAADVQDVHGSTCLYKTFWARSIRVVRWGRWLASSACGEVQFTAYGTLEEAAVTLRRARKGARWEVGPYFGDVTSIW